MIENLSNRIDQSTSAAPCQSTMIKLERNPKSEFEIRNKSEYQKAVIHKTKNWLPANLFSLLMGIRDYAGS